MTRQGPAPSRATRHGTASRRAFVGLGAAGVAGAAVVAFRLLQPAASPRRASGPATPGPARPARTIPHRRVLPENSLAGDPDWEIRHPGTPDAILGYAGAASVLTGEPFP